MNKTTYFKVITSSSERISQDSQREHRQVESRVRAFIEWGLSQGGVWLCRPAIEKEVMETYSGLIDNRQKGRSLGSVEQDVRYIAETIQLLSPYAFWDVNSTLRNQLYARLKPLSDQEATVEQSMKALGYSRFKLNERMKYLELGVFPGEIMSGKLGFERLVPLLTTGRKVD
ncbi:MAG: hypothetical protein AABX11_01425 [Nanoarchaeota archaeon]